MEAAEAGEARLRVVAHLQRRRDQREGHALVGMAAGIGFDAQCIGHRHRAQQRRLVRGDAAGLQQAGQQPLRRRGQELRRHIGPGNLGDDTVGRAHLPALTRQPLGTVAHQRRRHLHEGRGLDHPHVVAQQQVGEVFFQLREIGMGDEIHAEGRARRDFRLDALDRLLHRRHRQAAGTEETQQPGLGHADHQLRRGDALIHGAGGIGVFHAEILAEFRRAQRRGPEARRLVAGAVHAHRGFHGRRFLNCFLCGLRFCRLFRCEHGGIQRSSLQLGALHHRLHHGTAGRPQLLEILEGKPLGEQVADAVAPAHRRGHLLGHQRPDRLRLVRARGHIGNHRHKRWTEFAIRQEPRKGVARRLHEGRVESTADLQHAVMRGAALQEQRFGGNHRLALARHHDLLRRVHIGGKDIGEAMPADDLLDLGRLQPQHRRHAAARGLGHQRAALLHQPQPGLEIHRAGSEQRDIFGDAVAQQIIGLHAFGFTFQPGQRADDIEGGLGELGLGQPLHRPRQAQFTHRIAEHGIGAGGLLREGLEQPFPHPDALRALTRKQEGLHGASNSLPLRCHSTLPRSSFTTRSARCQ